VMSVTIYAYSDVRFVFTSSVFLVCRAHECLIYIICLCLRIVVSNVFLFCLSSSSVLYVVSFSGLSIFDCPFGILFFPRDQ